MEQQDAAMWIDAAKKLHKEIMDLPVDGDEDKAVEMYQEVGVAVSIFTKFYKVTGDKQYYLMTHDCWDRLDEFYNHWGPSLFWKAVGQ